MTRWQTHALDELVELFNAPVPPTAEELAIAVGELIYSSSFNQEQADRCLEHLHWFARKMTEERSSRLRRAAEQRSARTQRPAESSPSPPRASAAPAPKPAQSPREQGTSASGAGRVDLLRRYVLERPGITVREIADELDVHWGSFGQASSSLVKRGEIWKDDDGRYWPVLDADDS